MAPPSVASVICEIADAASKMADAADQFRKRLDDALKLETHIPQTSREAAVAETNGLKKDADALARAPQGPQAGVRRSRRAAPAGERRIEKARHTVAPSSATDAWKAVLPPLSTIANGFNLQPLH